MKNRPPTNYREAIAKVSKDCLKALLVPRKPRLADTAPSHKPRGTPLSKRQPSLLHLRGLSIPYRLSSITEAYNHRANTGADCCSFVCLTFLFKEVGSSD